MLSSNSVCNLANQSLAQQQVAYMQRYFKQPKESIIMSFPMLLSEDNNRCAGNQKGTTMYKLASQAYTLLASKGLINEEVWNNKYETLAYYGLALNGLFFSFNLEKETLSLYTSSIQIIKGLAQRGFIIKKKADEPVADLVQKCIGALDVRKIVSALQKDGDLVTIRLDVKIEGGNIRFIPTAPRTKLNFRKEIVIPYSVMEIATKFFDDICCNNILEVTMGNKVRVVTKSESVLELVYGKEVTERLLTGTLNDVRAQRFYLPSLGASIYSLGKTNIKLELIDNVKVLPNISGIDLSGVNVDYSNAKVFFNETIKKLDLDSLLLVANAFGCGEFCDGLTRVEIIENFIYSPYSNLRDIYTAMSLLPSIFNMEEYKKLPCRYGNMCEEVAVPHTIEDLENLMRTGVFRVMSVKSNGTMSNMVVTNNKEALARMFGNDYIARYESEGTRLRLLTKWNQENTQASNEEIESVAKSLGLTGISCSDDIVERINKIDERRKVAKQAHLVVVRNCDATEPHSGGRSVDYYKNIDLRSVVSITRLS